MVLPLRERLKGDNAMVTQKTCPVCGSQASVQQNWDSVCSFYSCPVCGRFEITYSGIEILNNPKLSSFLLYNRFDHDSSEGNTEYRYHTTLNNSEGGAPEQAPGALFCSGFRLLGRSLHASSGMRLPDGLQTGIRIEY